MTGTSTSTPTTVASAAPERSPNRLIAAAHAVGDGGVEIHLDHDRYGQEDDDDRLGQDRLAPETEQQRQRRQQRRRDAAEEGRIRVCDGPEKLIQGDLLSFFVNRVGLALVCIRCILVTMSEQKETKINLLLARLGDTELVSSRWLRDHGYSSSLVARYVASGWLMSPARGVYMRKSGRLQWEGVVRALQLGEGLSLHVGGRFALAWQGHEHYLRLGEASTVTLYGAARLPGWVTKLPLAERFESRGKGPFDFPPLRFTPDVADQTLLAHGLDRREATPGMTGIVCSTPERAMLELCDGPPSATLVYEVDALMQSMTTLRPKRVGMLLLHCRSIKAKRLFLALAERHSHAWLAHVPLDGVDLGRGKRSLVPGGRLHSTYQITLPRDLDEHLG
jgi:hypothetical protein